MTPALFIRWENATFDRDSEPMTWEEFAELNPTCDLTAIRATVDAGRVWYGGGGAAPVYSIRPFAYEIA